MSCLNDVKLFGPVYQIKDIPTKSGEPMLSFTIKTWTKATDNSGNKIDKKYWHDVVAYNKNAEVLRKYLVEGKKVLVNGVLDYYKDKNGVKRTNIKVMTFCFGDYEKPAELDTHLTSEDIPF